MGRPRRHGHKFACADPATWLPPSDVYAVADAQDGTVRVRAWADLHPKPQEHATRGTCAPRPLVRGMLILVEVSRLPRPTQPRSSCGCGGTGHSPQIWPLSGGPPCGVSTWSIPSASSNRR